MTSCFKPKTNLIVTRVCEDSRNWTSAVFAPEIYQVDPHSPMRLWSNPSHHHDPTPKSPSHHHGHVPSSGQLSSRQQAAQTASHHHRPPILEITKIFGFLAFKCYLNELKISDFSSFEVHFPSNSSTSCSEAHYFWNFGPMLHVSLNDF